MQSYRWHNQLSAVRSSGQRAIAQGEEPFVPHLFLFYGSSSVATLGGTVLYTTNIETVKTDVAVRAAAAEL
ncbi:hypothetical protein [Pareuzebyella sediminis]|uniref:hypothetical protein n=1 Tax=Pareuzebyella sediminis TaxID=2607998 RepID=UPI0011EDBC30|nr:hypothetical protein [Pareuzebyella sediminis]